jgi:hypothetical protein
MVSLTLAAFVVTGCGKGTVNPTPPSTLNAPAASFSTPPTIPASIPANSAPPVTGAPGTPDSTSSVIQDGVLLKVTEPVDAADINSETVTVKGQTVSGATISVHDNVGVADAQGNFSIAISLEQGLNAIDIIATDDKGNTGEALILVNCIPPGQLTAPVAQSPSGVLTGSIPLKVTQPVDAATLNTDTVTVKGQTAPGAIVIVNESIETADAVGNFNVTVDLVSGPNAIDVIAQNDDGDENEVIIIVNVVS